MSTVDFAGTISTGHQHGIIRRIVGWLLLFLMLAGLLLFVDWLFRSKTFPVHEIIFEGEFKNVSRTVLEKAIVGNVSGNYLMTDLNEIKHQVEMVPWVYQVSVRRKWPSGIYISFVEQEIVARWGESDWLNHYGQRVVLDVKPGATESMPYLHGPEGTSATVYETYQQFSRMVKAAGLEINRLVYSDRRNWELRFDNGISVILAKTDPDYFLARFVGIYPHVLAQHATLIKQVDLRYTNGFAVAWINAQAGKAQWKISNNYKTGPNKG